MEALLGAGADPASTFSSLARTALHTASAKGHAVIFIITSYLNSEMTPNERLISGFNEPRGLNWA